MENDDGDLKLVLVSSRLKNASSVISAAQSDVMCVHYKFDSCSTTTLLELVAEKVSETFGADKKFSSLGLVMHSQGGGLVICGGKDREKILTTNKIGVESASEEWQFFTNLITTYTDNTGRLDIIATSLVRHAEGVSLLDKMQSSLAVEVNGWPTFVEDQNGLVNGLYFDPAKLQHDSGVRVYQPTLAEFEKIRTVGKGAYGAAVLYRKKDDESLVILKEINMHELSYTERQLALNEVKVLGMLHHPNIIAYFDSFEEDGTLMIEMEYADGGTLAQFLSTQVEDIAEYKILDMFRQMLEACKHLHDHNILHRDLKTANIFLTKSEMIKLGDFGISKIIATKGATTVLGTPYYISPEMCEGKPYNAKSDVWALGCILYEMASREKTFEGSNLPALVNKIMKGQYKPLSNTYSSQLREMVEKILHRDPEKRPHVEEVLNQVLTMLHFYEYKERMQSDQEVVRSMLYFLDTSLLSLCPIDIPIQCIIKTVCIGMSHVIATTEVHTTFTWGKGGSGQLGHGNRQDLSTPTSVEALQGKYTSSAACGADFSIFVTDNGLMLSCGAASSKCLGHCNLAEDVLKPRLCESLLSTDVVAVSCGPEHAAVVTKSGAAYTWGNGVAGRLGHGSELDRIMPTAVTFAEELVSVKKIKCGTDGTMFLTDDGTLYASGSNKNNKLGLNKRKGFLLTMKTIFYNNNEETEVSRVMVPTAVKLMGNKRCTELSLGPFHSAVTTDTGQIYAFGLNRDGQLGIGNRGNNDGMMVVKSMEHMKCKYISCCSTYTVAVTERDMIYIWGQPPPVNLEEMSLRGVAVSDSEDSDTDIQTSKKQTHSAMHEKTIMSGRLGFPKSMSDPDIQTTYRYQGNNKRIRKTASEKIGNGDNINITPIEISLTDAARRASASGHPGTNHIKKLVSSHHSLLIQVNTTAPQKCKRRRQTKSAVASSEDNLASSSRSESAHQGKRGETRGELSVTPDITMTHGGGLDTTVEALASDVTAGALYRASDVTAPTPYRRGGAAEDDAGDEQMRTWLRLELENGLKVTDNSEVDKPSDLETSGGLPSSTVNSGKSTEKDSGFETQNKQKKECTDSDTQTYRRDAAIRNSKRRLRKKINVAVTEIDSSDSEDEAEFSSTTKRIQYSVQSQRKGDPYREKLKVKTAETVNNSRIPSTRNPSNVNTFKMKSPYSSRRGLTLTSDPITSQYRGPGTFSRDLASVQEKAELLQEKLYSLEHLHQKQSKELESFKSSKQHLEVMFQEKWDKLETQKTETEEQVLLYRKLLAEERDSAGKVQGQLENKVKSLQNQLENQKQQLTTQHDVMYELQGVICSIQQKQNEERSRLCVIQ